MTGAFPEDVWQPVFWPILHIISLNYSREVGPERKLQYFVFVRNMAHVAPSERFRTWARSAFQRVPFTYQGSLRDRESFARWVHTFRTAVHDMEQHPRLFRSPHGTFEEVRDALEWFRARCGHRDAATRSEAPGESGCVRPVKTQTVVGIAPKRRLVAPSDTPCHPCGRFIRVAPECHTSLGVPGWQSVGRTECVSEGGVQH